MLEQVIESYIKKIKNEVLNEKISNVPLAYLVQKDIPESIKHYFDQEVENWIAEEEQKFDGADRFDYDMPEVRLKIDEIFDYLKQTANFTINRFNQLLERAVKLERDFTIKPHQTMCQFIFKDQNNIQTKKINDVLRYFFVHKYYKEKLTEYFNLKYLQEINLKQFKVLLQGIDEKVFQENIIDESKKMVRTIANFINNASEQKDIIPTDTIATAFFDRDLEKFGKKFQQLFDSGKKKITISEFETYLVEQEKKVSQAQNEPFFDFQELDLSTIEMESEHSHDKDDDDDEDLLKTPVIKKSFSEEQSISTSKPSDQLANMISENININLPDLDQMITKRWKKKFIKALFKKSENEYNQFIAKINSYKKWIDASNYIEDTYYQKNINPYSKESIAFSDTAYMRFFPKEKKYLN